MVFSLTSYLIMQVALIVDALSNLAARLDSVRVFSNI